MKRAWLKAFTWAVIVETNRRLCRPKGATHQSTSDGYDLARQLWESVHRTEMTLGEATEVCRRCHQLAPFCNFNGNTFVAVMRQVISMLSLLPEQTAVLRSVVGHIVAGTATPEDERAFGELLSRLANPGSPPPAKA